MLLLLPSTVMKLMLARVEPSMRIWAAMGELSTRLVELATIPSAGAVMMAAPVAPLLAPFKVRRLLMVICSGYEPGQTKIVLLAGTELIAAVMVAKEVYWGRQVPTAAVAAKAGTEASATQVRRAREYETYYLQRSKFLWGPRAERQSLWGKRETNQRGRSVQHMSENEVVIKAGTAR